MARILLTEDDESVRAFVKRALELDGHEIAEAEDGGIALEILTARRGEFELVLSDIMRRTPFFPISPKRCKSIVLPLIGVKSILKSPE